MDERLHSTEPRSWIVVATHPHRESLAIANLARQGFGSYCPLVRRRVRHARRTEEVARPLFPGYLFVRVAPALGRWRPILSTLGVRTVVRCGDRPSLLDDGFVRALERREVDGFVSRPARPYVPGQQVRILGGAFDGIVATIIDMDERERLVVLMELLQHPARLRVEASRVMPAA